MTARTRLFALLLPAALASSACDIVRSSTLRRASKSSRMRVSIASGSFRVTITSGFFLELVGM